MKTTEQFFYTALSLLAEIGGYLGRNSTDIFSVSESASVSVQRPEWSLIVHWIAPQGLLLGVSLWHFASWIADSLQDRINKIEAEEKRGKKTSPQEGADIWEMPYDHSAFLISLMRFLFLCFVRLFRIKRLYSPYCLFRKVAAEKERQDIESDLAITSRVGFRQQRVIRIRIDVKL